MGSAAGRVGGAVGGLGGSTVGQIFAGGLGSVLGLVGGGIAGAQAGNAGGSPSDALKAGLTMDIHGPGGGGYPSAPAQPAMTSQASDPNFSAGGWNMKLSQQLAASAGGTLFSTPTQWSGGQIGNDPNQPRKSLVGA